MAKVALLGYGFVGKAYHKVFPDAVIYDEPLKIGSRDEVNRCDMAIVCVPTDPLPDGSLDMGIVESVVDWIRTPLILIKSALMPGTVDKLVDMTGKRIAVSVETVGMGNYFVPPWRFPHTTDPGQHSFLIVGGETETASACADILWSKMSPDTDIHLISAVEAEICKLFENSWAAAKVTFANTMFEICKAYDANYTKVLQAWGADGRVEKMHMRVVKGKQGWSSHCWDKDVPALSATAKAKKVPAHFIDQIIVTNKRHLLSNQKLDA